MIRGLFGNETLTFRLRGGLEETSATHRGIAGRVANALQASANSDFADALNGQAAAQAVSEEDLQRDMASLADTQLRYEATAKLLQKAYADLRTAIRDRG